MVRKLSSDVLGYYGLNDPAKTIEKAAAGTFCKKAGTATK
jgi:hypothetical protein